MISHNPSPWDCLLSVIFQEIASVGRSVRGVSEDIPRVGTYTEVCCTWERSVRMGRRNVRSTVTEIVSA